MQKAFKWNTSGGLLNAHGHGRENARILTRDYERLPENHEGMVYVVMIRLMLRRLTKNCRTWQPKTA
jgi:hypothetical protein